MYEKNDFQLFLFTVCIWYVQPGDVGGMPAEGIGQLPFGAAVWFGGEDERI